MTTIRDVARQAEVSVATVSRVLNDDTNVRPPVRRAVLQAIEQLGYQPNVVARNLRRSTTQALGMVHHNLASALASRVLEGADSIAQQHGFAFFVSSAQSDPRIEEQRIRDFLGRRVDGLLCYPVDSVRSLRDIARQTETPLMLVGRPTPDRELPTAVTEARPAFTEALDDFANAGHERVAIISDVQVRPQGRRRIALFENLTARYEQFSEPIVGKVDAQSPAEEVVRQMFDRPNHPTALVIGTDHTGPSIIRALKYLGVRIPHDVSIVMFGHSDWATALEPEINTLGVDPFRYGREAAAALIRLVHREPDAPRVIRHRFTYIRRGSIAPAGHTGNISGDGHRAESAGTPQMVEDGSR